MSITELLIGRLFKNQMVTATIKIYDGGGIYRRTEKKMSIFQECFIASSSK
jgi:hypothetical protein